MTVLAIFYAKNVKVRECRGNIYARICLSGKINDKNRPWGKFSADYSSGCNRPSVNVKLLSLSSKLTDTFYRCYIGNSLPI